MGTPGEEEPRTGAPAPDLDAATDAFTTHRELLFSIAYGVLGTVTDAEDVLQEAWLSWAGAHRAEVAHPRAYLVRIVVNQALARLRRVRRSRETYVGPWLPEPIATGPDAAEAAVRGESVSLALLVVLETLSPLERAVFVLREAFGYQHAEIAAMLGRSPEAVRQVAHRARRHVQARRPRFRPDAAARRAVTDRFVAAAQGGDVGTLLEVLAPEVTLRSDGGGRTPAARRVVRGREKIVRFLAAVAPDYRDLRMVHREVNGDPAAVLLRGGAVFGVLIVEPNEDGTRIHDILAVLNPEKLTRLGAGLAAE